MYVCNHGVPSEVTRGALAAARAFFALPEAEKLAVKRPLGRYRGFIPTMGFSEDEGGRPTVLYEAFVLGIEIDPDDAEIGTSRGMLWPNLWPVRPAGFQPALAAYWNAITSLSDRLLAAFALAIGLDEQTFTAHFTKPLTNISLLHYPPRPRSDKLPDLRPHHDTNALTVLLPGEVGGLEVQTADRGWIEAPPLADCFVVNIGNMMECWSGGRFRSTMHRVNPPHGVHRYSIGYFAVPNYETEVRPLAGLVNDASERSRPSHAGRDLAAFVARTDDFARRGAGHAYLDP